MQPSYNELKKIPAGEMEGRENSGRVPGSPSKSFLWLLIHCSFHHFSKSLFGEEELVLFKVNSEFSEFPRTKFFFHICTTTNYGKKSTLLLTK